MADTNVKPWEIPSATEDQLRELRLIDTLARRVELVPLRHGMALLVAVGRA